MAGYWRLVGVACCACLGAAGAARAGDAWADKVVSYAAGSGGAPGYNNPATALGEPTRFTGVGTFPGAVTPFNSPYLDSEIVSIGTGGSLVVSFDEPVTNDAANPFGIDLLVFGNSFFEDTSYPNGVVGKLVGGAGTIEVSPDGVNWTLVPGTEADGLFPTLGYADLTDPYSKVPGGMLSDFTKPVDPLLVVAGLDFAQLVLAYNGSGGGAGVDIGALGLSAISFVRVSGAAGGATVEIDGFSDVTAVPTPGSAGLVLGAAWWLGVGRKRRTA